jgi:hypothetical protein
MASTNRLLARYRELEADADAMIGDGTPASTAPATTGPAAPVPTLVHAQTLDLLDELFSMVSRDAARGPFAPLLKTLHVMRSRLLRDFASVPAETLVEFLHGLGGRMMAIGIEDAKPLPAAGESTDTEAPAAGGA